MSTEKIIHVFILLFSCLVCSNTPFAQPAQKKSWFDVRDLGADVTGQALTTKVIQQAIDECSATGGGTVYFRPGRYLSGQLFLKSNTIIYLEAGAILLASRNPENFPRSAATYQADTQQATPNETCLLYADSVHNISIVGKGVIEGQAVHVLDTLRSVDGFIEKETANARTTGVAMRRYYAIDPKVRLVFINRAKDITVRDIQIRNAPDWGLHIGNADNVLIDGVTILSSLEKGVNSDGIDIDGCRNVRIANCYISTGDDAICLKSTNRNGLFGNCENIVITNCTLTSTSSGLKIGTETHGDFRGVIFSNCVIRNTNRGISIVVRDGATVEDVLFTDLIIECNRKDFYWWGDGDPIRFILLRRSPDSRLGRIRNITVRNVSAKGQGTSLLQGHPQQSLEQITLENVAIVMENETLPDRRATDILQMKQVEGVKIINLSLSWSAKAVPAPKWRSALNVSESSNLIIDQLFLGKTPIRHKQVVLERVKNVLIDRVYAPQLNRGQLWQATQSSNIRIATVYALPPDK